MRDAKGRFVANPNLSDWLEPLVWEKSELALEVGDVDGLAKPDDVKATHPAQALPTTVETLIQVSQEQHERLTWRVNDEDVVLIAPLQKR